MPSRCLAPDQVARFYRIWFALLHFVNERLQLIAPFPMVPPGGSVEPADAIKVRNALWADDALRERFLAENPAQLSEADLELVASWSHRVEGSFYVLRAKKAYTVFLTDQPHVRAYGVL